MADADGSEKKTHRARQSGPKAEKKKKSKHDHDSKRNPKAFAIQSVKKAAKAAHRTLDLEAKKRHVPLVDRTPIEPPPIVVAVVGPPKVGKTTLINNLIKSFTREKISALGGPITVVSGKKRRLTLVECNNDINSMIDVAKVADLVLLLIDASFGFEMEIFEFLNVAQVHGFPKIMGVLTHLDLMKNNKSLQKTKKRLKNRFWTEVYQGAKLFYLSGISHGLYPKTEMHNLGRFISVMKFRPLQWRSTHPYVLVDRYEDLTDQDKIDQDMKCDRIVCLYGYVRGAHLKRNTKVHLIGCGDYNIKELNFIPDPCPLPDKEKKRSLTEKERLVYAPMAGVGGIVYDKDAVYIDLGGSKAGQRAATLQEEGEAPDEDNVEPENKLVSSLHSSQSTIDTKMAASQLSIFKDSTPVTGDEVKMDSKWTMPEEETVTDSSGRVRRRAVFDNDKEDENEDDENDEDSGVDDDASDAEQDSEQDIEQSETETDGKRKKMKMDLSDVDFESDDDEDEDFEDFTVNEGEEDAHITDENELKISTKSTFNLEQWKENFKKNLSSFGNLTKPVDIRRHIYGTEILSGEKEEDNSGYEDDMIAGIFKVKLPSKKKHTSSLLNQRDCSHTQVPKAELDDINQLYGLIKDCFVTGKWGENEDAETLLQNDIDDDDDEDIFGDFEDMETGEKVSGSAIEKGEDDEDQKIDGEDSEEEMNPDEDPVEAARKKRAAKKRKLKEMFDADYDDSKGPDTYYDDLKNTMTEQAELNRSEFQDMEDDVRVQYEGFRAGLYVRMEIERVPCEFVNNFDPSYPVIVGGLLPGEDNIGYIQVRFKKHRWHDEILKNRDPIIVSLGWRRFQTIPLYAVQDHNGRFRSLKYTPEHLHCVATMYGPITPPSTGLLAVKSVADKSAKFRIAATGVIVDLDKSIQVVKKLKLVGTPLKIFKNTAFVKGMFNSALEVAKFQGASIRTVSGIRGQVKRALKNPPVAFRATFEDKILLSDIVFCRTWYPLTCPKLYNPVCSLLLSKGEKQNWQGMKSVGQLRKEQNLSAPQNPDSFYKPIERKVRKFKALQVPKKLQKDLPFKSKPKNEQKKKRKTYEDKRAVVMEKDEKKAARLMHQIFTINRNKMNKEKAKRDEQQKKFNAKLQKQEESRDQRIKEQRKKVFRLIGQEEKRKQAAARKKGLS